MLQFARVEVGRGSASGCALCGSTVEHAYAPASVLAEDISRAASRPLTGQGPNLVLCGPEPLDHPEIDALFAYCIDVGAERVGVETDTAALAVDGRADGLVRIGVRHLWMRIFHTDPAIGDRLAGTHGRTGLAFAGVQAFLAAAENANAPVVVTALVPVCRHNLEGLPEIVGHLAALGVHATRLTAADELPVASAAWVAAACDTGMVNGLWVETDGHLALPVSHAAHAVAGEHADA